MKLFLVAVTAVSLYRQMYGKFKTRLDAFWHSYIPLIFFLNSFSLCQKFPIHEFFRSDVLWELFDIGFPYKHCLIFQACLPTRQYGVENRDKTYTCEDAEIESWWHSTVHLISCNVMVFFNSLSTEKSPNQDVHFTYHSSGCCWRYCFNCWIKKVTSTSVVN